MNLSRCQNGHFYDKEKFATCPHCSQGSGADDSLTTIFTEDLSSGVSETQPMNEITLPVGGMPADAPTVMPPSGDMTIPLGTPPTPMAIPPVPATWAGPTMQADVSSDDDSTVAFYDDIFSSAASSQPASSAPGVAGAPVQQQNKVTTPCVGWLIAIGGAHIGQDFRLKVGKNFIGRDAKMDIALTGDKSVSRNRHAIVVYEPKKHLYLIQPGESSELVYRNNEVVLNPIQMQPYDMITVGEVNLLFMPLCGDRFNWSDLLEEMNNKEKKE